MAAWPTGRGRASSDPSRPIDSNQSLIVQAASGDASAFDRLMRRDQARLYRVALRLLGRSEDAEEALQDAFLRIHRGLSRFDPERSWEAWTYRIIVNVCRSKMARRRALHWLSLDAWREAGGQDPEAPAPTPSSRLEGDERRERLLQAITRLPLKERAALTLTAIEGLTAREAAQALDSSESTVRSQASRAREKLRRWLEEA